MLGRPSKYTDEVAALICERLACGETLTSICREQDMPGYTTVMQWLRDRPDFQKEYARAREQQADYWAEMIIDIAKEATDRDTAAAARVKIQSLIWYTGKAKPKKYGPRVLVDEVSQMTEQELLRIILDGYGPGLGLSEEQAAA